MIVLFSKRNVLFSLVNEVKNHASLLLEGGREPICHLLQRKKIINSRSAAVPFCFLGWTHNMAKVDYSIPRFRVEFCYVEFSYQTVPFLKFQD